MSTPSISIQNKNGIAMLIDEEDLGLLTQHKNGHWCFCIDRCGYALLPHKKSIGGNGRSVAFHRLAMDIPVGLEVNHINRDRLDNRKENLRLCTRVQTRLSTVGYGASKFKGAHKSGSKWQAAIRLNGVQTHLGLFNTETEAAKAYDTAARLYDCEYRTLNFPDEVPNA